MTSLDLTLTADLVLRPAGVDDAPSLAAFAGRMFRDTYGSHNRASDLDVYCGAAFTIEQQRRELADRDRYTALVFARGELAGYAQLCAVPPPPCVAGPSPLELNRLYVDRPWHGRGAAQALMAHAIEIAQQRGAQTLYLSVWKHNHRAIAFYITHGFEQVGSVPFPLGTDVTGSICMVRPLPVAVAGSRSPGDLADTRTHGSSFATDSITKA